MPLPSLYKTTYLLLLLLLLLLCIVCFQQVDVDNLACDKRRLDVQHSFIVLTHATYSLSQFPQFQLYPCSSKAILIFCPVLPRLQCVVCMYRSNQSYTNTSHHQL
jgi:hypothetical protein